MLVTILQHLARTYVLTTPKMAAPASSMINRPRWCASELSPTQVGIVAVNAPTPRPFTQYQQCCPSVYFLQLLTSHDPRHDQLRKLEASGLYNHPNEYRHSRAECCPLPAISFAEEETCQSTECCADFVEGHGSSWEAILAPTPRWDHLD